MQYKRTRGGQYNGLLWLKGKILKAKAFLQILYEHNPDFDCTSIIKVNILSLNPEADAQPLVVEGKGIKKSHKHPFSV